MAYFDNAATTYPKPDVVYSFMNDFYKSNGASAGRGTYEGAVSAGNLIAKTRGRIQELLHCPAKQVIFTPTATIALNMIIQGIIKTGVTNVYIRRMKYYKLLVFVGIRFTSFTPISTNNAAPRVYV